MKTKPKVWLNVTPGGRGSSLLSSYPALTNEMEVIFMKVLPLPGKKGGCEHQMHQKILQRAFQRDFALFGMTRRQGQMHLLFCSFYNLSMCEHTRLLGLCIYLSYCQYLKCMKNTQPEGLNTNLLTYKWP